MSVCTLNGTTAPTLWANELPRFDAAPYYADIDFNWHHIPDTVDDFYDWATFAETIQAYSRPGEKRVVYTPIVADPSWPSNESESYEVAIIVHGFVSSINLSPFGNWTRREQHAPAAVRSITLESQDHHNAFNCQQHSLRVLEQVADMTEGATYSAPPRNADDPPSIWAEQDVFVKVRSPDDITPALTLTDNIDRGRHARRIARRWLVEALPPTYLRRPSGTDLPIQPHAIRTGDFVELTVTPTIRAIRRGGVFQPTLVNNIAKIVKLWSTIQTTYVPAPPTPQVVPIPQAIPTNHEHAAPQEVLANQLPFAAGDDDDMLPDV
ncbi:hypothetical protein LXA43DRAFT_1105152 [Ganoderma leucocontextum]|nr:hypothetical protein LXA43DRAFT_1105152 [Ganoderma leucocontextum]